jgi:hypothetical protein
MFINYSIIKRSIFAEAMLRGYERYDDINTRATLRNFMAFLVYFTPPKGTIPGTPPGRVFSITFAWPTTGEDFI